MKDELRRAAQQKIIDAYERKFRETKNPLYTWDAYLRARNEGLSVPDWVFAYLDNIALSFGTLVDEAKAGQAISKPNDRIASVLGMATKGAGTIFSRFADNHNWEWLAIAKEVEAYMDQGQNETDAIDSVVANLAAEAELVSLVIRTGRDAIVADPETDDDYKPPAKSNVRQAFKRYKKGQF